MAIDANTGIEDHPDSTVAVNTIVNNNWSALKWIFNPALTSGDSRFALIWKVLVRSGTLPTTAARAEYIPAQSKAVSRLVHASLVYAGALSVPTDGALNLSCTLTGDPTVTFTPMVEGREVTLIFTASAGSRTPTWPVGIRWVNGAAPGAIASGKIFRGHFLFRGTAATDIVATYSVEP